MRRTRTIVEIRALQGQPNLFENYPPPTHNRTPSPPQPSRRHAEAPRSHPRHSSLRERPNCANIDHPQRLGMREDYCSPDPSLDTMPSSMPTRICGRWAVLRQGGPPSSDRKLGSGRNDASRRALKRGAPLCHTCLETALGGEVDRLWARAKVAASLPQGGPPTALEAIVQEAPQIR